MKNVIFLIAILFSGVSYSQNYITCTDSLKPGIYRNFTELRDNSPSLPLDYEVKISGKKTFKLGTLQIPSDVAAKRIKVYGFCDGKNVYLLHEVASLSRWLKFMKVEFLDRYIVYSHRECYSGTDINGNMSNYCEIIVNAVNIRTGEEVVLNKKRLKEILSSEKELLAQYEQDSQRGKKHTLIKYIEAYCKLKPYTYVEYLEDSLNPVRIGVLSTEINKLTTEEDINEFLKYDKSDSTYEKYYERILNFEHHSFFYSVSYHDKKYKTGEVKETGVYANHSFSNPPDVKYKIGVWLKYYENGQIKEVISYNVHQQKVGEYMLLREDGYILKSKRY